MAHITHVYVSGGRQRARTHHRIPAGLLTPMDEVRYRPGTAWFKVESVRPLGAEPYLNLRITHTDQSVRVWSSRAMVDVKYLGER